MDDFQIDITQTALPGVAHIAALSRAWLVRPEFAQAAAIELGIRPYTGRTPRAADYEGGEPQAPKKPYTLEDGIAIIGMTGPITKGDSSMSDWFGGCSAIATAKAVKAASYDPEVRGIMLKIDSPGGEISGIESLAHVVAMACNRKPVYAYADDECCSAALWVGTQADKLFSNATAMVGSIGVYTYITDSSKANEDRGYKVHVVSSGKYKGGTVYGAPVKPAVLDNMQERIDTLCGHFVRAIADGRGMKVEDVHKLATGEVWIGQQAADVGITDGVRTFDEALGELIAETTLTPSGVNGRRHTMSDSRSLVSRIMGVVRDAGGATDITPSEGAQQVAVAEPDPRITALDSIGVSNADGVRALASRAALGDRYLVDVRKYAKHQAVRAHGADLGGRLGATVDGLAFDDVVAMGSTWEQEADAKYHTGQQAAVRATAPATSDAVLDSKDETQAVAVEAGQAFDRDALMNATPLGRKAAAATNGK